MTITLPPNLDTRLREEASRRGMDASAYAATLIEHGLTTARPNEATLALFAKWEQEDATDDPEEIARRQREFEEFKEAINQNRRDSDGPNARIPFP